jgi:cobalt-zinc-cadmium efflux system outer membrane protein
MKAHLEQTKIENEVLLQEQEVSEFEASLKALLNRDISSELVLPKGELPVPLITAAEGKSFAKILDLALKNSKMISAQKAWLGEAESARSFSRMGYLPDFMLSYTKPFGTNAPDNAYSFSVEMSIPLWFFARQNSETSVAAAKNMEAEKNLERVLRQIESETKGMSHKVETLSKLLKIYDTALIPQAISALNSSRSAYRVGRVGFQELLDAERSLYSVRVEYYRNFSKFVETLTSLERTIGVVISDLPENQP